MPFALIWPFVSGKLWPLILKYLPWIIAIALLIGAYIWIDRRGFERGAESRQPEIVALQKDNATLSSNNLILANSIDVQNKAVAQLKAESDQRAKDGATALAEARKTNEGLVAASSSLKRSATIARKADDCSLSPALKGISL